MLNKLKILAFSDTELRSMSGAYSLQINPESYSHSHPVDFSRDQGTDTAGSLLKFNTHPHQGLKFDAVIDSTGAVPGVRNVIVEIKLLKNCVYDYHGKIHSPNYLKVIWGGLAFKCMLSNLEIKYELFDPYGVPIRARISLTFEQYETPRELALRADKKSADLSHAETVADGTSLPLMTYRVYDQSDLYVHVARANGMNDLMHLNVGDQLLFPPSRDLEHE